MDGVHKLVTTALNLTQTLLSIVLAGVSVWFFIELKGLTDLRNRDKYLLDFDLYWPQFLPWVYFVICVIVICVSMCGVYGSCTGKRGVVMTYITFLILVTVAALAAGVCGLVYGDAAETDMFISNSVKDAFDEMKVRQDVHTAFGAMETRLRCCGIAGASDYTATKIPESCCDKNELVDCGTSASRRIGCEKVLAPYARYFMKWTSIGSILLGVICLVSVITATMFIVLCKHKKDRLRSEPEKEPLKLPL